MGALSRFLEPPRLRTLAGGQQDAPLAALVVLAGLLVAQVVYELARHEAHTHEAEI